MSAARAVGLSLALGVVVTAALAWIVLVGGWGRDDPAPRTVPAGERLAAATGPIRITNSLDGRAVITARNIGPGGSVTGAVTVGNPNDVPMAIRVGSENLLPGALASSLRLDVGVMRDGQPDRSLFSGPLGSFARADLGTLQPDNSRRVRFTASLPRSVGNEVQGGTANFDIVWRGTGRAPPPECGLRAARSRLFVYRARNAIRLVTRHRANRAGRLRVAFHERRAGGGLGRQVGQMTTRFRRSVEDWSMNRVRRRQPAFQVERMRRSRTGFIARMHVIGAPSSCARRMNLTLTDLRRVDRQFVWFQRGSFRILP